MCKGMEKISNMVYIANRASIFSPLNQKWRLTERNGIYNPIVVLTHMPM